MKQQHEQIILIVGNGRSGTTMMRSILGNHPSIYACSREIHFFEFMCSSRDLQRRLSVEEAIALAAQLCCTHKEGWHAVRDDCRQFYAIARSIIHTLPENTLFPYEVYRGFLKYMAAQHGKSIPCDKTPKYVFYLREILTLFPEVKIINMMRDPRDVLLSQKNRWKIFYRRQDHYMTVRTWANYHPISTSGLWNSAINSSGQYMTDRRMYTLKFEDVLEDPEREIRKLCEFLEIRYVQSMLDVPRRGSSVVPDDPDKTGIDRTRSTNWQRGGLNSAELFINQIITARNMKKSGYKPVRVFPNPLGGLFYVVTFPLKLLLAFLFQVDDQQNIWEAITRRLRQV